jgi:hypothetical protein
MMATTVYESKTITLIDGTSLYLIPLKIRYLREFMDAFEFVKTASDDEQAIFFLSECARISMQQYYPSIKTVAELEDLVDLDTVYDIVDIAGGIKIRKDSQQVKEEAVDSGGSWQSLDLAKLESEAFLLGIWKSYEELELSLSMPELLATLEIKRELDYSDKKFMAAMQGVDLDKQTGKNESNAWEKLKAKVFSGGKSSDPNDITSLQGINAQKAGFGIGMGLGYEDLTKK